MLLSKFGGGDTRRIEGLEARFSIRLPEAYRNFLLRYNGGHTPRTNLRRGRVSSDIRGFYGLGPVPLSLDGLPLEEWVSRALLPIAKNTFGDFFCLCARGDQYGQVVFCDHERGMAAQPLANGFPAFLALCKSSVIPEGARRSIEERRAALIANGREAAITPALVAMWQAEIDRYGGMVQEEVVVE